ncbi:MAG TPA: pilus assembly protein PilM [Kofleriaceae bacterium]|jgi:hypothetical protein
MASRIFAVDLGAWSVKLALASPGLRGASLVQVIERLVPPGDGPVDVRAKEVLRGLVQELRLGDDPGYLGVYGDQVFTQVLEFGFKSLRRAELDKAVGGELEGVVPVDLEDMVYSFEPLPPVPAIVTDAAVPPGPGPGAPDQARGRLAGPAEGMRVLAYAMRRDRAEQLLTLARDCGFEARGILACGGGAARLVERTPSLVKARADGPIAVVDIGHDRTDVIVIAQGKAVFSRSIARAGRQVTESIAKFWSLPFADAERAKHSDGFIASTAEPATSDAWARIHQVTVQELAPFARDLRQTIAACRARTGFTPVSAILVGGGAKLRGLGSFLTEQLGMPAWRLTGDDIVALAGPRLAGSAAAGSVPIDSAALTVGMAYDAAGGRPQFDLRSGDLAAGMDFTFLKQKGLTLGIFALTICGFAAASAFADLHRLHKAETVLTQRLADESKEVLNAPKSAKEILALSSPQGDAAASPLPKASAYDVMLMISNKIPPKDKLTLDLDNLTIDDAKIEISGTTKKPEEIDLLVTELKKIDCFKDVTPGATDATASGQKFRLTINAQCM